MSYKSILQIFILILIFIILFSIYFFYFSNSKEIVYEEDSTLSKVAIIDKQQVDNTKLITQDQNQPKEKIIDKKKNNENISNENPSEKELQQQSVDKNILTEVEYVTKDNKGNKYQIFAKSAKTSSIDKDVLNLNEVRGIITSDIRSTIYIVSDFAKYNSVDLNSKFYNNVIINFEDKQIDCDNFTMNMNTNLAKAYGNVVVTDPKSIMHAGIITLDIKTKDININPETEKKIKIVTE